MFSSVVSLLLLAASLPGQTPVDHKKLIARLGAEADVFERTAYRVAGLEKLIQTVPDGVRIGRNLVGVETKLPGYTREIVSEYGFVSVDEPGGSLREVRRVDSRWSEVGKRIEVAEVSGPRNDGERRQGPPANA